MNARENGIAAAVEFMAAFHPDRTWFIVGGLLRDTENGGGNYKDIDIFIVGYDTDLLPKGAEDGEKNAYLLRAYTVKDYPFFGRPMEINLIFMRGADWTLERMTDRCDFGICQIGYCPVEGRIYRSDDYMCDKTRGTLTLARETTQARVDRMKAKFPFHRFHNPSGITVDGEKSWCYDEETQQLTMKLARVQPKG